MNNPDYRERIERIAVALIASGARLDLDTDAGIGRLYREAKGVLARLDTLFLADEARTEAEITRELFGSYRPKQPLTIDTLRQIQRAVKRAEPASTEEGEA